MQPYYNRTIRKMVIAFGNLFNDITLVRFKPDETEDTRSKVPITYAQKENYFVRLDEDPNLTKKVQMTLPRISYNLVDLEYDATRKQQTNVKQFYTNNLTNKPDALWNPVPYNFNFEMSIYVRNIEDGAQIVEQILPYFAPDYTVKVNLVPHLGVIKEIPITLNDIKSHIDYEGNQDTDIRIVIWTLTFTMKGFLFGPSLANSVANTLIRTANTNIFGTMALEGGVQTFSMSANGFSDYAISETVYQGTAFNEATAKGQVLSWNSTLRKLEVKLLGGVFKESANVYGGTSNARYVLGDITNSPQQNVTITVQVDPLTANTTDDYGFSTTITEYN